MSPFKTFFKQAKKSPFLTPVVAPAVIAPAMLPPLLSSNIPAINTSVITPKIPPKAAVNVDPITSNRVKPKTNLPSSLAEATSEKLPDKQLTKSFKNEEVASGKKPTNIKESKRQPNNHELINVDLYEKEESLQTIINNSSSKKQFETRKNATRHNNDTHSEENHVDKTSWGETDSENYDRKSNSPDTVTTPKGASKKDVKSNKIEKILKAGEEVKHTNGVSRYYLNIAITTAAVTSIFPLATLFCLARRITRRSNQL